MPFRGPQLDLKELGIITNITVKFGKNSIRKVLFHEPATIVFWDDGTKTVVKCSENDKFDPHTGLAMAICKKAFGNTGMYNEVFKKWIPEPEEEKTADQEEMRCALYEYCSVRGCDNCKLLDYNCNFSIMDDDTIKETYKLVFGT